MQITNNVVVTGTGWEIHIPVVSLVSAQNLLTYLCELRASKADTPYIIRDGDMHPHAFIIPMDIKSCRIESGCSPKVSQDQIMVEHLGMLKAQKAWYKSHTKGDSDF